MAAIANTHAKAAANPKAQRPAYGPNGPVSAPLVVNAAKPYSFAYEVVDPAGNFMEIDCYIKPKKNSFKQRFSQISLFNKTLL